MLDIQEEKNGGILTVKPEGQLDTLSSETLESFLDERYDEAQQIIFDLSGVDYIASAGLRVIIQAYKHMEEKDGILLRNVSDSVKDVLEVTGYIHILKIE